MKPNRLSCSVAAAAVLGTSTPNVRAQDENGSPPYRNPKLSVEQRVEDLLARMSLEEKVDMLSGTGFESKPNARLGIPAIKMADGPQGSESSCRDRTPAWRHAVPVSPLAHWRAAV